MLRLVLGERVTRRLDMSSRWARRWREGHTDQVQVVQVLSHQALIEQVQVVQVLIVLIVQVQVQVQVALVLLAPLAP